MEIFVELADTLVADFDLADFLHVLAQRCAELVEASEVGLLLASPGGQLRVAASSSERMHTLELFEIQNSEGPCLEVFRSGRAVVNGLVAAESRWPNFARQARAAGYQVVHALPMRHNRDVIGVVNIFDQDPVLLNDSDVRIAQALTDIATFAILQSRAVREATHLAEHLQTALHSRILIEQAKGVLSERLGVDIADAFIALRDYSRNTNQRIAEVALWVVQRDLAADQVLAGARAKNTRRRSAKRDP